MQEEPEYTIELPSMDNGHIALPLKRFLLLDECPLDWIGLDLYLFRDESVVFYVGQSQLAFARVWEHLFNGFKGQSIMGRFVWVNWPRSMKFTIELFCSGSEKFASVGNDLNAAEAALIQHWRPCFNLALNGQPFPLPEMYLPPNAPFRRRSSLNKLIHEAERAVKADETKELLQEKDGQGEVPAGGAQFFIEP